LAAGQLVEVTGQSSPGFAPDIAPTHIERLGLATKPKPHAVTFERLAAGQEDCSWVEWSGIVHSIGTDTFSYLPALEVAGNGGRVVVPIETFDRARAEKLIDAEVTIQGVCATHFNRMRQFLEAAIQVNQMEDIVVSKATPGDPFAAPVRPINRLLQFAPQEVAGHRVKVRGVVAFQQPGRTLFMVDETQGLQIEAKQATLVQPGDVVEALGFPAAGEFRSPVLEDAVFRKVGSGPAPMPARITPEQGNRDIYDARLVQMEAVLLNRVRRQEDQILELQASNFFFYAELDAPPGRSDPLAAIPERSLVRLTGICLVLAEQYRSPEPKNIRLLLHSAADVELLVRPSWWTAAHTLWVLEATLVVFIASLAWVATLRRQVKTQTEIIHDKLKRETLFEERTRIARDIHDDLGADLTHLSFLSEEAQETRRFGQDGEYFRSISSGIQQAMRSLDEIVWMVNPKNDCVDRLVNYICNFAEEFFRGSPTRCRLDVPEALPEHPLSPETRNSLFFAVKEALNNVRKHAQAPEVMLRLRLENGALLVSIEDKGRGFDPIRVEGTGNGLTNMRKRLEKVGGRFALDTQPGAGATIRLTLPLPASS
jgi:signal transduction histidine kinase